MTDNYGASEALSEHMFKAGYTTYHTGGGCMAWHKELTPDGLEYLLITFGDVELGESMADARKREWHVGRYRWVNSKGIFIKGANGVGWWHNEGWVCLRGGVTLAKAIRIGEHLPQPAIGDEVLIDAEDTP